MFDHRRTRTRRGDDRVDVSVLKDLYKAPCKFPSFISISRVKRGLAATRLALVKNEVATDTP
jgi:hypothetical protein